jgi:hypothetical protein
MRVDRLMYKWTDIMKLIVAFHNVENTCNKLNTLIVCRMYSMASESKMPENVYCTWGFHFHTSLWEESCPSLLSPLPRFSTSCHLDLLSKDVTAEYRETVHCEHYLVTLLAVPVLFFPCGRCMREWFSKMQWWTQCSDPYHRFFSMLVLYNSLYQSCENLDFHHS